MVLVRLGVDGVVLAFGVVDVGFDETAARDGVQDRLGEGESCLVSAKTVLGRVTGDEMSHLRMGILDGGGVFDNEVGLIAEGVMRDDVG